MARVAHLLERVMHLVENRIEHEGEEGDPVKAC